MSIHSFLKIKKLILLYSLKNLFILICISLCLLLNSLVLLQRAEEGAFRRAITASQGLDSKDLVNKTIVFSAIFVIAICIIQSILFNIYSRSV